MKDKEYHEANFCNFCFSTYFFPPKNGHEFNFIPAQYCINKTFELTKSCMYLGDFKIDVIIDVIKW